MTIAENIRCIRNSLPGHVKLVAVAKTRTPDEIMQAYRAGQRCFGENKAQELISKFPVLPQDVEWHFIGHLQTNKVRFIAPIVSLIHSADSLKLLKDINKEAVDNNRLIPCLLEFHIAGEETKFGLSQEEAFKILESDEFMQLKNISIAGVMGMATFTDDYGLVRKEFRYLRSIFDSLKQKYFTGIGFFREISMGMSSDYRIAVEEGATIVRIGSSIFGER